MTSPTKRIKPTNQKKVIELEKEIARLEKLAHSDVLVSVYNRRGFLKFSQKPFEMAVQARGYARRKNDKTGELCVLLIDVDNFKHYNDAYSYALGDNILKTVGSYFNNHLRKTDIFGRWGGDEFVILLPFTEPQVAFKIMANHVKNFAKIIPQILREKRHFNQTLNKENITFSFGIAGLEKEKTIQALINKANKGLKLAKKKKNAIVMAKNKNG